MGRPTWIGGLQLFLALVGSAGVWAQRTPVPVTPPALPPILTTTAYQINTSKPLFETAVEVEDLACGTERLCNASLGTRPTENCFECSSFKCKCDDICRMYGDCCADVATGHSSSPRATVNPSHIVCHQRFPKTNPSETIKAEYVFMVGRCPRSSQVDAETVSKCEAPDRYDYEQATPVTEPGTNLVYRNSFCAQCFGVENYEVWTYTIRCLVGSSAEKATSKRELWELVLNDTLCTVTNSPPNGTLQQLRTCVPDTQGTCNVTGLWKEYNKVTEDLCQSFYGPVEHFDDRKMYRNVFCAMCNGAEVDRKKLCFRELFVIARNRPRILISKPLSVLIDFNAEPVTSAVTPSTDNRCQDGEIYDPLMAVCSPLLCSRRRILTNSQCEPLYRTTEGLGYSFSVAITPSRDTFVNMTSVLTDAYESTLSSTLGKINPVSLTSLSFETYSSTDARDGSASHISAVKVQGRVVSTAKVGIREMERDLRHLGKIEASVTLDRVRIPLHSRFITCPEADRIAMEGNLVLPASYEKNYAPQLPRCGGGSCIKNVDYMSVHGILDCPHIELDLTTSDVTFNQDNHSLIVLNQTVPMKKSSYHLCGNTLKICDSVVYNIQNLYVVQNNSTEPYLEENDLAMTIVSLVCVILSLICLFATFIIYCIIPQLRTLPGKNTMALIFHLFCAQLIFLVGIQQVYNKVICRAMGILIHYFWLTAFSWMAISAFHMCAVFSNMAASRFNTRSAERKTLFRYFVVCNVYALVFVISCIVYHVVTSNGQEVGYGGRICFLNEPVDIGIFFAVPLGLVLIFNAVCFIRTVVSIRSVPDMKNAKNKPNRNHMHVYFRLSILLGFTWIVGFVATILRTNVWWYIFIILNGLQGVFIFLAYCLNKRTVRHLKSSCSGKSRIKYSRPSKTTSSERVSHSTTV